MKDLCHNWKNVIFRSDARLLNLFANKFEIFQVFIFLNSEKTSLKTFQIRPWV